MTMGEESMSTATIENNPRVTILLLNYNGWEDAIECLESVYKITYPNWELILVDNGSVDGSVTKIKEWATGKIPVESKFFEYDAERKPIESIEELFYDEEEARVKVLKKVKEWGTLLPHQKLSILRIEKNRGFTGGNNIGIEYVLKERETRYILLLSNDTVVDKEFLGELVKVGESDEKIGIVGAVNYYYDEPEKIWFSGGKINFWNGKVYSIRANEIDKRQHDMIKEADYVAGSCLLIKKEVIKGVGILDREYFAFWEDADWCVRAHKAGYKVVYVSDAKIWHKVSSTTKKISGFYEYYNTRNTFLFMKKHATRVQFISFILWFFLTNFWFMSGMLLIQHKNMKALISFYKGIKDGLLHVIKV
ncbi:MAG: Glycosyl transferase family 2 [Candidatus Argoarchaeum ethanivorans]|uniref:Glycosyl transferase family 2 n=1 Tax=Candidatus Argoarchaeum ethanivorans TaxID=2608793 RepID=A0A811T415_9EURY|nr:MAG: Glycosyl transferase family 2 [Candidatus Argoarchaeum ethanivorans]